MVTLRGLISGLFIAMNDKGKLYGSVSTDQGSLLDTRSSFRISSIQQEAQRAVVRRPGRTTRECEEVILKQLIGC